MILGIIAIALVALIGYVWVTRGFYSALIHLLCTLLAGGVAFGVWEPVSSMLLEASPNSGFLSFLEGSAYGLGLALPFGICLAIFRVIADVILRANVKLVPAADYVGGGICGVLAGIPTVGILLISLGFLRLDTGLLGYQPLEYTSKGMIQKVSGSGMILPFDAWTNALYGHTSKASFCTDTPLATYYPDLAYAPHALRINNGDGAARNVFKPSDFKVQSRYTVGKDKNLDPAVLFRDTWNTAPQSVTDIDGNPMPTGSYLEGFVLKFNSGAKERGGDNKVVFGASQMRLLCANADQSQFKTCYAIASAAQADSASTAYARFRFDTKGLFFASVGGTSDSSFTVEFAVPPGYTPLALYVKNARHEISDPATAKPKVAFDSPAVRDVAIASGDLVKDNKIDLALDDYKRVVEPPRPEPGQSNTGVRLPTGFLISNAVGRTLHKTTIRSMTVLDEGNFITDGEQIFTDAELRDSPMEKALRVEKFAVGSDVVMVQLDVSIGSQFSWMGAAAQAIDDAQPPLLMDTNDRTYEPVGWIFVDATKSNQTHYRYLPINPVRALKDVPTLSRSAPDNKLKLIFLVNLGSKINRFAVGNTVVAELKTPVEVNARQGGG